MKPRLTASLAAWGGEDFTEVLKDELAALGPDALPLVTDTGHADARELSLSLIRQVEVDGALQLRVGVFFQQILAGCSCGDDPVHEPAYCELELVIDKSDGKAEILPVS
ncbi:glucosamine--fructose-6-phosphate aminotransferase [Thiohalobacter thiocyanaticus]|uniref:Glucosamine--fructose-6-phosphate aminotransferase n=1 Tax=Thiohalobacter thiocyanaticus TaxID=585455 RepID=A0A426QHM2_9GAMM|nr:glucosamine--fructose-6-phosphate aminotransferase [Thiohalobacter thiocyanaticus]RRQ21242.1 glucosamine--fructose-6-phosphate aminotransferase [Thiohalobacter thiocyanaticus]